MKTKTIAYVILATLSFFTRYSYAQDVNINIDPRQAFILDKTTGTLEVKICNCHMANVSVPSDKLRPQISFPDNLTINDVTNSDDTPLTNLTVQALSNDPSNHSVRLLLNSGLPNASCVSFFIHVTGKVGTGSIIATLGFQGPQTIDNLTANDNAVAAIPVQVNLPVKLKEFRAKKEQSRAMLEWTTTEEINSSHFDVQRSKNGKDWTTLTSVPAMGDTKMLVSYTAIDPDPFTGENLYRLHMIDNDGSATYSSIRSLIFELQPVLVFPNPVKDILNIGADDWERIQYVEIRDNKGEQLYHSILRGDKSIDLKGFPMGIYIVKIVKTNSEVSTHKIAIVK